MATGVRPARARAAARLKVVVVLPTPPFWLKTAMTLMDGDSPCAGSLRAIRGRAVHGGIRGSRRAFYATGHALASVWRPAGHGRAVVGNPERRHAGRTASR